MLKILCHQQMFFVILNLNKLLECNMKKNCKKKKKKNKKKKKKKSQKEFRVAKVIKIKGNNIC